MNVAPIRAKVITSSFQRSSVKLVIALFLWTLVFNNVMISRVSSQFRLLFQAKDDTIAVISLIGERNSGTKWVYRTLMDCFNHTIRIKKGVTRHKHWFQYHDGKKNHSNALVISVFRNPYDWSLAMSEKPHHAPAHQGLEWKTFLSTPWTMPHDEWNNSTEGRVCQSHFHYDEVITCAKYPTQYQDEKSHYSASNPVYEMKSPGRPYESLLDLRADKIRNHLSVREYDFVKQFVVVHYEDLLHEGIEGLVRQVEERIGRKAQCGVKNPQATESRVLSREFVEWLRVHVDWEAESLVGYEKGRLVYPDVPGNTG